MIVALLARNYLLSEFDSEFRDFVDYAADELFTSLRKISSLWKTRICVYMMVTSISGRFWLWKLLMSVIILYIKRQLFKIWVILEILDLTHFLNVLILLITGKNIVLLYDLICCFLWKSEYLMEKRDDVSNNKYGMSYQWMFDWNYNLHHLQ